MLRLRTRFRLAVLFLTLSTPGLSQDDADVLKRIPQAPARVLMLNNDGVFVDFASVGMSQYLGLLHLPDRVDEITLLKKDWVQDELKMTPTQKRHYRETFDEFLKKRAAVPEDLTDSLDEKQLKRFQELLVRSRIRALGIRQFFQQPELGLTKEEVAAMEECLKKIEPEYSQKITKLRDKTLNELQKPLTDEQREQLKTISSGFLEDRSPRIEILVWQLRSIDRYKETIADKEFPEIRGLFTTRYFRVDVDGCLTEETYLFPVSEVKDVERTYVLQSVMGLLCNLCADPDGANELQMTDEQTQVAKDAWNEYWRLNNEWLSKVEKGKPGYSDYEKWQMEYLTKETHALQRSFLPHQKQLIETMSALLEILRAGFPSALVYGRPGRILNLTADQKSEIKDISAKCLAEIESTTNKWEEEIFKKLKSCLQEDTRERLDIVFSESPSFGFSDLNLLLRRER